MIEKAKQENIKKDIMINNFKTFSENSKKIFTKIKNNKDKIKLLIPIAIVSTIFMIYMIVKTFSNIKFLNRNADELYNLKYFNIKSLENNEQTRQLANNSKTINDLIKYNLELSKDINRYQEYLTKLQSPYTYLMQHIFLPQLNIWKDPFLGELDTSIIGARFLEKNPYNDISLIQKRSTFVKDVGNNNEFNQVENILIGNMVENEESFYIPITIKFIASSKRSFLLLVEKLSTTSNQKNITLINEFIYNLRENIKTEKQEEIELLKEGYDSSFDTNKIIGYNLYKRIFEDKENLLIDDKIINKTIEDTVTCNNNDISYCLYKFRDKYRGIPSLAYTIGLDNNKNKTNDFKKFLKELAPIIKINKFTFERNMQQSITNYENTKYIGEIQMDIYGRGIDNIQVDEIADILGQKCIGTKLSPEEALKKIDNTLINIGSIVEINTYNTSVLRELQTIIENIQKDYNGLTNYNKIIKLFEIYRMMSDGNLCDLQ